MKKYIVCLLLVFTLLACNKPKLSWTSKNPQAVQYNQEAIQAMKQGQLDEARRYLDMALELDPDYFGANVMLIEYQLAIKDYRAGIKTCDKLISLAPGYPQLYVEQGILYDVTGNTAFANQRYAQALLMYEKRLKEYNEKSEQGDLVERAFLYRLMGDEDKAAREVERLKKIYPDNKTLIERGSLSKKEYVEAELKFRQ